jgi:hypothetical protein
LILFFIRVELSIFTGIIYPESDVEEDHQAEEGQLDETKDAKDANRWLLLRRGKVGADREGAVESVDDPTDAHQEKHHPENLQGSPGGFLGDKNSPFILDDIHNHPPCEVYEDDADDKTDLDGKGIIQFNGDPENPHFQKRYDAGKDIKGISFHGRIVENLYMRLLKLS